MKIPIKKYVMNEALSWEERYRQLEKHHEEETTWMIAEITELEKPPYARAQHTKSADLDKMAKEGITFPIRRINGIEVRGLLGDIVKEVTVNSTENEDHFNVTVVIVVRCVETGYADRDVILTSPVTIDPEQLLPGLTKEQHITVTLLEYLISHEIHEDLRLDGEYIVFPTHEYGVGGHG